MTKALVQYAHPQIRVQTITISLNDDEGEYKQGYMIGSHFIAHAERAQKIGLPPVEKDVDDDGTTVRRPTVRRLRDFSDDIRI